MQTKLNIIRFIEEHPSDWEQRLTQAPYALKIKHADFGPFVMFNYDQIESDNYDPIVAEARGLVLRVADGEPIVPVRKGFNRFFNLGEGPAAQIDWDTAEATIKEDGTLVFVSSYGGQLRFGTRQNFDLADAPMNSELYPTFQDLWNAAEARYPRFNHANFIPGLTYCFELCSRHNRIVIDYPEAKIFLLAVFDTLTGNEFSRMDVEVEAQKLGCDVPAKYKLASEEDYARLVENFGIQHEGLVVRDACGRRVKMKSKLYFDLHKSVSNGAMDLETIVGLCRKGEQAEFLSYFPEYEEKFSAVETQLAAAYKQIAKIRQEAATQRDSLKWTRKDFALFHVGDSASMLWFKAWEDKLTDDFVMGLSDEKFIQLFKIA